MKPKQQRIAIAEHCGWSRIENAHTMMIGGLWVGYPPNNALVGQKEQIPDYLDDLNAMHEAEETLDTIQHLMFYQEMVHILDTNEDGSHRYGACLYWETMHATASQRCEAFLKATDRWQDDAEDGGQIRSGKE